VIVNSRMNEEVMCGSFFYASDFEFVVLLVRKKYSLRFGGKSVLTWQNIHLEFDIWMRAKKETQILSSRVCSLNIEIP
jgi:hypothetical protein